MKTNLLAQNDNLVIENLKADVGKSVFDLSHSVTFPISPDGAILPICCLETLPSDSFEINVECLLRQLTPLKVPLMTNLRLNTAFYYCDNRLAWKKWDRFMTGGRSGNEVYDIPRVSNVNHFVLNGGQISDIRESLFDEISSFKDYGTDIVTCNINRKNSIHTYLGISLNRSTDVAGYELDIDDSPELPVAFPFFGYQMICRDYYTNVDRLLQNDEEHLHDFDTVDGDWTYERLFPSDEDEIRLHDGVQWISGFDAGDDPSNQKHGFILDKVRYHDVRPDYFTTSKKAPMRGDAPALTAVASNLKLPSGTEITLNKDTGLFEIPNIDIVSNAPDTSGTFHNYSSGVRTLDNKTRLVLGTDSSGSGTYATYTDKEKINTLTGNTTSDLSITGSISTDFTAADIRLLSQLTVWQELNMLHEPYYNDFLNAHFDGVRVGESPVEKPQYIGGTSQLISINEILQTSQTSDTSPLGTQGATAMSLANNFVGRYYSNNYGYIIGIAYIVPDLLYKPAMPRGFSRRTKEDYYSPEFANLSMQATLNKEIFFSDSYDWNNQPWGYTGAYDELRSIPNRIAGELLNEDYQDLTHWVLTRNFTNANRPAMSHKFLSLKDNVDQTAWASYSMPKFMLQVANYIKAVRPMPKVAIPKAL